MYASYQVSCKSKTLCMLGNVSCFYGRLLTFFKINSCHCKSVIKRVAIHAYMYHLLLYDDIHRIAETSYDKREFMLNANLLQCSTTFVYVSDEDP